MRVNVIIAAEHNISNSIRKVKMQSTNHSLSVPKSALSIQTGGLRGGPGLANREGDSGQAVNDAVASNLGAGRKLVGTCGNGSVGDGVCSDPALCCSTFGWCDTGPDFCGDSPTGGSSPVPAPTTSGGGTCGNGSVGNGICSDSALCCSTFGWCDVGPDFCGGNPPPTGGSSPVAAPPVGAPPTSSGVTPIEMCDGDGGTCICGNAGDGTAITLNRFWGNSLDEKVWGCGGAFHLDGATLDSQWGGDLESASLAAGVSFSQDQSFDGWEGCCAMCGMNLEIAGKLSSGWYCEKDMFSTGIWLKR